MKPTTGKAKGHNIRDVRLFVEAHGGADAWERLRAAASDEDRTTLDSVIASGWYDVAFSHRMLHAIGPAIGMQPRDVAREYGRFAASHDLKTTHRLFMRMSSPAYMLEKIGDYWGRFYDTGQWKVTRDGPNRAHNELRGFAGPDPFFCEFLAHYATQVMELTGAKNVRLQKIACAGRGDAACVWDCEWR